MSNKELSIILRLRDEASKQLEGFRGNLQRFANAWRQNWLAITAAVTASIVAARKAWDLMLEGVKAEQLDASFRAMAEGMGVSADRLKAALSDAAAGTVDFSNVADKVNALLAQGLGMDQIIALMRQARVEARIFGQTTAEAFDTLADAVNSGRLRSLERVYGMQVSLKDAVSNYAKATGMSTQEVERNYQAQALANHVLAQSRMHLQAVNLEIMTNYEKVQMLQARWKEFSEQIGQALWQVLGLLQGFINQIVAGFFQLLEWGNSVLDKLMAPLVKFYEILAKLPGEVGRAYRDAAENLKRLSVEMRNTNQVLQTASQQSAQEAVRQYDLVFAKVKETGDKTAGILKEAAKRVKENATEAAVQFNALHELARQTARNMESAFSDIFFKAFTGQIRSIKQVFADFGRMMLQTIAQILARLLVIKLFTAMGFGGLLMHSGGMVRKFHSGGFIRAHQGLAPDEVPIIAQTGEGVLSRKGMAALGGSDNLRRLNRGDQVGGGQLTVNVTQVIQAWDASDVWRNRKILSSAIADDIYNNGKIRSIIRSYA